MESKIGSCVGADGAIFAQRKALYVPLEASDINDLVIPLSTVRQGYRVVFDQNVYCREEHLNDLAGEFKRQVRISNRTIKALLRSMDLLNPFQSGSFSWMLFFHKWLRFLFPHILLLFLGLNLVLVIMYFKWVYLFTLVGATLALAFPFVLSPMENSLVTVGKTFVMMNLAILVGWKRVMSGDVSVVWRHSGDAGSS